MSYVPQTDEALARAVETGAICAECSLEFLKPNGVPALCRDCWSLSRTPDHLADRKGRILTQYDDQDIHRAKAKHKR